MINWELFSPKNLAVVALLALLALVVFNYFFKRHAGGDNA
jgi:hypothetical protein